MDDERTLVEGIRARPSDDAPRLAYAAWLQARGDPRGDFIDARPLGPGRELGMSKPLSDWHTSPLVLGPLLGWLSGMLWWTGLMIAFGPATVVTSEGERPITVASRVVYAPLVAVPWAIVREQLGDPVREHGGDDVGVVNLLAGAGDDSQQRQELSRNVLAVLGDEELGLKCLDVCDQHSHPDGRGQAARTRHSGEVLAERLPANPQVAPRSEFNLLTATAWKGDRLCWALTRTLVSTNTGSTAVVTIQILAAVRAGGIGRAHRVRW